MSFEARGVLWLAGAVILALVPFYMVLGSIGRIVEGKGLRFPILGLGVVEGLRNFRRIIADETQPERRQYWRRLERGFYLCFAWAMAWLVFGAVWVS